MITEIITTLISAIFGGGAVAIATAVTNRRANKQLAEAEADKASLAYKDEEISSMHKQINFKDERISALNEEIARKETSFIEQTNRLRECQDREFQANANVRKLQEEVSRLQLQLKDHRCVKLSCLDRMPKNEHTRMAEIRANAEKEVANGEV